MTGNLYTPTERDDMARRHARLSGVQPDLKDVWTHHLEQGGITVASYDASTKRYKNVELKAHIDSNEQHKDGEEFVVTTPGGATAKVRVIHRKAQLSNPMGKWKYLVEFIG